MNLTRAFLPVAALGVLAIVLVSAGAAAQTGCDVTVADGDSIQAAIDAANEGDTVCVEDGTFSEKVTINTKGLELVAASGATPVIDGSSVAESDSFIGGVHVAGVDGVRIDGLTITGFDEYGVGIDDGASVRVENNTITHNGRTGIHAEGTPDAVLANNSLRKNSQIYSPDDAGIFVEPGSLSATNVKVADNRIGDQPGDGIRTAGDSTTIRNNVITNTSDDGIHVDSPGALVTGNSIEDAGVSGIEVQSADGVVIRSNSVTKGSDPSSTYDGTAVLVTFSDATELARNNLSDNDIGIRTFDASSIDVHNNSIEGNKRGVWLRSGAPDNRFRNNTITGNQEGVNATEADDVVDARFNDWGASDGPSGGATDPVTGATADGSGDAVTTNVRFDPWNGGPVGAVSLEDPIYETQSSFEATVTELADDDGAACLAVANATATRTESPVSQGDVVTVARSDIGYAAGTELQVKLYAETSCTDELDADATTVQGGTVDLEDEIIADELSINVTVPTLVVDDDQACLAVRNGTQADEGITFDVKEGDEVTASRDEVGGFQDRAKLVARLYSDGPCDETDESDARLDQDTTNVEATGDFDVDTPVFADETIFGITIQELRVAPSSEPCLRVHNIDNSADTATYPEIEEGGVVGVEEEALGGFDAGDQLSVTLLPDGCPLGIAPHYLDSETLTVQGDGALELETPILADAPSVNVTVTDLTLDGDEACVAILRSNGTGLLRVETTATVGETVSFTREELEGFEDRDSMKAGLFADDACSDPLNVTSIEDVEAQGSIDVDTPVFADETIFGITIQELRVAPSSEPCLRVHNIDNSADTATYPEIEEGGVVGVEEEALGGFDAGDQLSVTLLPDGCPLGIAPHYLDSETLVTLRPAEFQVNIESTNAPVEDGSDLEVDVTVENPGDVGGTTPLELIFEGTVVDERTLEMESGTVRELTLTLSPSDEGTALGQAFVQTSDDREAVDVTVVPEGTDYLAASEVPAGELTSLASPWPMGLTLAQTFGDFEGAVYLFDEEAQSWSLASGDETLGALDALAVKPTGDEPVDLFLTLEDAEPPRPTQRSVQKGWNFVGPRTHADAETALSTENAPFTDLVDPLEAAPVPFERSPSEVSHHIFDGKAEVAPVLDPFKGYFAYAQEPGTIPGAVPAGASEGDLLDALQVSERPDGSDDAVLPARIMGDRTLEQGTYRVPDELRVEADLTIEPGARLEFARDAKLTVAEEGSIEAIGFEEDTEADPGGQTWSHDVDGDATSRNIGSQAVARGTVYVGSYGTLSDVGKLQALDADSGALEWTQDVDGPPTAIAAGDEGIYASSNNHSSNEFRVYAFDASTGTLEWTYDIGAPAEAPAVADGRIYVGAADRTVYALDAASGSLEWTYETDGAPSSPAVQDGTAYVGSTSGNVTALDTGSGSPVWVQSDLGFGFSSPIVSGGTVYIGSDDGQDGHLHALDAASGSVEWSYRTSDQPRPSAVQGGTVYGTVPGPTIPSGSEESGYVYAVDAATGDEMWRYDVGEMSPTSPTVAYGVVYTGVADYGPEDADAAEGVHALDAATGSLEWIGTDVGGVFERPALADGTLYAASLNDITYALETGFAVDPVEFVGAEAETGWWQGIHVESPKLRNTLDHVRVSHAGANLDLPGAVTVGDPDTGDGGALSITNSELTRNAQSGLWATNESSVNADACTSNLFDLNADGACRVH